MSLNQDVLSTPIQFVKGVGPKLAKTLSTIGIATVEDFFEYFPRSYQDRRNLPKIAHLQVGENVTVFGTVSTVAETQTKTKHSLMKCTFKDATGTVLLVWFNQSFIKKLIKPGGMLVVQGKIEFNTYQNMNQISVSETEVLRNTTDLKEAVGTIIPIFPLTFGLYQQQMRTIARSLITTYFHEIYDPMPASVLHAFSLMTKREALKEVYFPANETTFQKARIRLIFDEFFYFQLSLALRKSSRQTQYLATPLDTDSPLISAYKKTIPYTLTSAQIRVLEDVAKDVSTSTPMNRLVQGDVGSGKTDIAILALLYAIASNKKAALMAPTQILAEQHFHRLDTALTPLGVEVLLLKGRLGKKQKETVLKRLEASTPLIVIGTQALIQDTVNIKSLGMMVVDEQHRFGVMQRIALKNKGLSPHCLFMTATPIPRSFMLTCFGDLDKSLIDEMPPGRKPAITTFVRPNQLDDVFDRCRSLLEKKQNLYIVYPLIEASEKLDLQCAIEGFEKISQDIFPAYRVGLLHGRMKPQEKSDIMKAFKSGDSQILVSTTVIEVGVDVPQSTMMIIMDSERFGLSQLHQLRGRIGRSDLQSHCFLVGNPKSDASKKRLKAMVDTTDGFKIAEVDLNIRGPGDLLGTRQAGLPEFKIADLVRDEKILIQSRKVAFHIIATDPTLAKKENQLLLKTMVKKYPQPIGEGLN